MSESLKITDAMLTRPSTSGIDVVTTLRHFAIITYEVDAGRLGAMLPERFEPDCVAGGKALVSVVPFEDVDFRAACFWSPKFAFGQTNYRAYVIDKKTGRRAVWFFGTCLGSWTVNVPRYFWKLPWHGGRFEFDCDYDAAAGKYRQYRMAARSEWGECEVELEDTGEAVEGLEGFEDLEAGLAVLTHPLHGYFYRRDGALGCYRIWHDRLEMNKGVLKKGRFAVLDRLGLVGYGEQGEPHSVMVQGETEFTIYLPPRKVEG